MKKLIAALILLSLITALFVACGTSSEGSGNTGNTDLHMDGATFLQSPITISKGSSINLIDDTAVVHDIQNGSWENGVPTRVIESGAPTVNVQFQGNDSHVIGPFNTAGTYHLYCIIHAGMNVTVIVQ